MIYFLYPETKGLHLEQIDHIFEGQCSGLGHLTQGVRESIKNASASTTADEEKSHGSRPSGSSNGSKEDVRANNVEFLGAQRG